MQTGLESHFKENDRQTHVKFGYLFILYAAVSPISISATNVILALIFLVGIILFYQSNAKITSQLRMDLLVPGLSLFLWAGLTAIITKGFIVKTDISNAWEYSTIILLPLFFHLSEKLKERIIMTLIIFSTLVSVLGIFQYFIPSIEYPFPRQMIHVRFQGFFSHPLHVSGFISIGMIVTLCFILFGGYDKKQNYYLSIAFVLNAVALLVSMSRSYYISVAVVILVLLYIKNKKFFFFGSALITLLLIIMLSFPNTLNSRIQTLLDNDFQANKERIYMWKTALRMANDHPLTGVGAGNWGKEAAAHYFPLIEKETGYKLPSFGHAHNTYLTWLSEAGIPGLGLFLLFWGMVMKRLFDVKSKVPRGSFDYVLIVGTIGGLGNLFIAGLFEHNFGTSVILLLISFLIGLSLTSSAEGPD